MKLIAALVVRDEIGRYLPTTIDRLLDFCDEVLVYDDGSRDGTAAWLREHAVQRQRRILVLRSEDSVWDRSGEGAARGVLLDFTLAYQPSPDWVLSIDADEWVADGEALREFLESHDPWETPAAVTLRMCEVWQRLPALPVSRPHFGSSDAKVIAPGSGWALRVDGNWAPRDVPAVWTPPHRKLSARERWEFGWTIPPRRLACGREPECVRLLDGVAASGVDLLHLGWADPEERQVRYDRYMEVDGGRFHSDAHLRSILEQPTLAPYPAPR